LCWQVRKQKKEWQHKTAHHTRFPPQKIIKNKMKARKKKFNKEKKNNKNSIKTTATYCPNLNQRDRAKSLQPCIDKSIQCYSHAKYVKESTRANIFFKSPNSTKMHKTSKLKKLCLLSK